MLGETDREIDCRAAVGLTRRRALLGGAATALALSGHAAALAAQPVLDTPDPDASFLELSRLAVGRPQLSPETAGRLRAALLADNPDFVQRAKALLDFAKASGASTSQTLAAAVDKRPDLRTVLQAVVRAWYIGIVGSGPSARVIEDHDALMFAAVADALVPPSYCEGSTFYWTATPPAP